MTNCLGQTTLISASRKPKVCYEFEYKKKTTLGEVPDAEFFARVKGGTIIYSVIKKNKKTVVFTSLKSNLSYEMKNKTIVYVS